MKHIILRFVGVGGALLFLSLFTLTLINQSLLERTMTHFVESRLNQEASDLIDNAALPPTNQLEVLLGKKATELREEAERELKNYKHALKNELPKLVADVISRMRNLDCDCRNALQRRIESAIQLKITSYENTREQLREFSEARYMQIVSSLGRDIRIFLGVNSLIFMTLIALSFLKPAAINHVFLPAGLMIIATIVSSYFYMFEQNWLYSIIYNDYTGYGYVVYVAAVFALLADITLNKGKVTTAIINSILHGLGQAASVSPC